MMTSIVQERAEPASNIRVVPPSVLLVGKKRAVDYIAPGLFRLNNTGELIIKAIGSFSIVTAVDVAEMIKRDVESVLTRTISLGTDSLVISSGESKRMSCIEIRLSKAAPAPEPIAPIQVAPPVPITEAPVAAPKKVATKKSIARKKATAATKKKKAATKKKTKA